MPLIVCVLVRYTGHADEPVVRSGPFPHHEGSTSRAAALLMPHDNG